MLLPPKVVAGIVDGSITYAFRRWREQDVKPGATFKAAGTDADVAAIDAKLDRLDRASSHGPWTMRTLALIRANPQRRAPDLAEIEGRETAPFKIDVRKLKGLGLTVSFPVGYEISPRGAAYLAKTQREPRSS